MSSKRSTLTLSSGKGAIKVLWHRTGGAGETGRADNDQATRTFGDVLGEVISVCMRSVQKVTKLSRRMEFSNGRGIGGRNRFFLQVDEIAKLPLAVPRGLRDEPNADEYSGRITNGDTSGTK